MEVSETIKEFIIDNFLFGESDHFNENTDLFEKGILDSTGIIELVGFIEKTFNITIEDEELIIDNFFSLSSISQYLQLKIATIYN
jgi:acyl carrier protein